MNYFLFQLLDKFSILRLIKIEIKFWWTIQNRFKYSFKINTSLLWFRSVRMNIIIELIIILTTLFEILNEFMSLKIKKAVFSEIDFPKCSIKIWIFKWPKLFLLEENRSISNSYQFRITCIMRNLLENIAEFIP